MSDSTVPASGDPAESLAEPFAAPSVADAPAVQLAPAVPVAPFVPGAPAAPGVAAHPAPGAYAVHVTPAQPVLPPENALRGLLFTLPVIPIGVVLWVVIWQWGFVASIVALAIAVSAVWLYRKGSGGRIGPAGIAVILVVTVLTLALAFLGGVASDVADYLGMSLLDGLRDPLFWDTYALNVFDNPDMWGEYAPNIVMAVVFAVLGTFGVFRRLAREAKAAR